MYTAEYWIGKLNLQPHPEGGFFAETYRSKEALERAQRGSRNVSTCIYFLMEDGNFSAFHRILSDEVWHFYAGYPLEVFYFDTAGDLQRLLLGNDPGQGEALQGVVPAGVWFGSRPLKGGTYSLVGCTVSPGFDFADFELANRNQLLLEYPEYGSIIEQLTRD